MLGWANESTGPHPVTPHCIPPFFTMNQTAAKPTPVPTGHYGRLKRPLLVDLIYPINFSEAMAIYRVRSTQNRSGAMPCLSMGGPQKRPSTQRKISPIACIPYKCLFWAILDLSFHFHFTDGSDWLLVNESMIKTAPHAVCDKLAHVLSCSIYAMAKTNEGNNDATVFMEKWDIANCFWRLNAQKGEE